ncbi:hypothetical protein C5C24_10215 [Rathayibacter sp. AY2B3]|nr:hypothetical protein C5C24_10215 [Rathayibacter sp. AY2B3]
MAGIAVLALALIGAAPASASSDTERAEVVTARAFLSEYGVPSETQDDLVEAYLAGEAWDSLSSANPTVILNHICQASGGGLARSFFLLSQRFLPGRHVVPSRVGGGSATRRAAEERLSARCEGAQRPRAENLGGAGRAAACVDAAGPYAAEGFQAKNAHSAQHRRRPEVGVRSGP